MNIKALLDWIGSAGVFGLLAFLQALPTDGPVTRGAITSGVTAALIALIQHQRTPGQIPGAKGDQPNA